MMGWFTARMLNAGQRRAKLRQRLPADHDSARGVGLRRLRDQRLRCVQRAPRVRHAAAPPALRPCLRRGLQRCHSARQCPTVCATQPRAPSSSLRARPPPPRRSHRRARCRAHHRCCALLPPSASWRRPLASRRRGRRRRPPTEDTVRWRGGGASWQCGCARPRLGVRARRWRRPHGRAMRRGDAPVVGARRRGGR